MELFTRDDKLSTVIINNQHLLPVLNRFEIRLGFGDATIAEICSARNINLPFFLDIINAFHNPDYFPEAELLTISPTLIVDYLQRTHHYYLHWLLPKIENQLESLILSGKPNDENLKLLRIFFRKYKKELLAHIMDEEESVFPYVLNLTEAYETDGIIPESIRGKSILAYEKEHSDVDTKLNDLKNLVIKFLVADYDDNLCNEFLITLLRFEKDLIDHARIEDKILVPVVARIEKLMHHGK
ncbi:MAG: hemerythrin domain-containing protein [Bacteroidota bacterium]